MEWFSIKIQKDWEKISLLIEPFLRYWDIDDSEESLITYQGSDVGSGKEPANTSTEIGAKIALMF